MGELLEVDARRNPWIGARTAGDERIDERTELSAAVLARVAIEIAARPVEHRLGEGRGARREHRRAANLRFQRVQAERLLLRQARHQVVELRVDRTYVLLVAP